MMIFRHFYWNESRWEPYARCFERTFQILNINQLQESSEDKKATQVPLQSIDTPLGIDCAWESAEPIYEMESRLMDFFLLLRLLQIWIAAPHQIAIGQDARLKSVRPTQSALSAPAALEVNHISSVLFLKRLIKSNFRSLPGSHPCQTQESKKSITGWGTFR